MKGGKHVIYRRNDIGLLEMDFWKVIIGELKVVKVKLKFYQERYFMKQIKKLLCIMMSLCIIGICPISVYAADPYGECGSKTGKISVKDYSSSYNSLWVSAIDNGISAWNNSSANVTISVSSSSKNYIEAAQFDDEWYGLTTQTCNILTGYTSKFVMQLNARTISSDATDYRKFIKSTVAHEFGHVFWLCDNPSTASKSIMKHRRDREKTTALTTFDINNVNAKY